MWKRFANRLRCPNCRLPLVLCSFAETTVAVSEDHITLAENMGVMGDDFKHQVDFGVLLCETCRIRFPIVKGLPVLLTYTTPLHVELEEQFAPQLTSIAQNYDWPDQKPSKGEVEVMRSFSQEWKDYKYDGVLWHNSYEDLEKTFLQEVGFGPGSVRHNAFVEIGCGLGVTTWLGHKHYRGDSVGVDLSLACFRAAQQYRSNPFLHFVQASALRLPFAENSFGIVYSRGVLHHTHSTHDAFLEVARLCQEGGVQYVWVYGPASNNDNLARRAAYCVECIVRPILSQRPNAISTRILLSGLTLPYRTLNWILRLRNHEIQKYTYERAIHAARDRFTPKYAHRHRPEEVSAWFREAGFGEIDFVDWRVMPLAQQDTFRRNVGCRGRRLAAQAVAAVPDAFAQTTH